MIDKHRNPAHLVQKAMIPHSWYFDLSSVGPYVWGKLPRWATHFPSSIPSRRMAYTPFVMEPVPFLHTEPGFAVTSVRFSLL